MKSKIIPFKKPVGPQTLTAARVIITKQKQRIETLEKGIEKAYIKFVESETPFYEAMKKLIDTKVKKIRIQYD